MHLPQGRPILTALAPEVFGVQAVWACRCCGGWAAVDVAVVFRAHDAEVVGRGFGSRRRAGIVVVLGSGGLRDVDVARDTLALDHYDHPDTDFGVAAEEGGAVYPAGFTVQVLLL